MKSTTLIAFLFIFISSFNFTTTFAQVSPEYTLTPAEQEGYEAMQNRIEEYEKEVLKDKIQAINEQLEAGEISASEATQLKLAASQKAAQNIKELNKIIDGYTAYIKGNYDVEIDFSNLDFSELDLNLPIEGLENLTETLQGFKEFFETIKAEKTSEYFELQEKRAEIAQRKAELLEAEEELKAIRESQFEADNGEYISIKAKMKKSEPRTTARSDGHLVLAVALNNAVADGGTINDTDYRFGGSRTFEIGYVRTTRVFQNTNWLWLVYGFSFQFNGLKPEGNRIFVNNNGVSELQEFEFNLKKNKFRMDNLIVPVHFQIGSSDTKTFDNGTKQFGDHDFKIGLGGFVGVNLTTLQKLKYDNQNGREIKDKIKSGYNVNNIIYGLSAYFGWNDFSFYAQYNLNPIFKNNPVDEHNFQLGIRYDIF